MEIFRKIYIIICLIKFKIIVNMDICTVFASYKYVPKKKRLLFIMVICSKQNITRSKKNGVGDG